MSALKTPTLTATIQTLLNTEKVVPRLNSTSSISIPDFPRHTFPKHGNNTLLIIPTANKHKTRLLTEAFEQQKPAGITLHVLTLPAESNVGEQPYNEAGVEGARNRIENALKSLPEAVLADKKIGTVIAASIENFIQRPSAGTWPDPVDYGLVIVFNATTGQVASAVSRGVTVPRAYFEHAQSLGLKEGQDENYGTVTVGEVMAANVEGVDRANWHVAVAGVSRYELLKEAVDGISMPW